MTPAEMESELSSLRIRVLQLEGREHKRAETWKLTHHRPMVRDGIGAHGTRYVGVQRNQRS